MKRTAGHRDASDLSFELTNDLSEMPLLAEHLERFCQRRGISIDIQSEVNLALDEIVTHIIANGNGDGADHRIRIHVTHDGERLMARVEDDGAPCDPLECEGPNLGIHLVTTLVDEISYAREREHNVLVIGKRTV